jgi:hypothetical protein
LLNSFENDVVIGWITDADKERLSVECLASVCEAVLAEITRTKADEDFPKLAEPVRTVIVRIERVCKAVVATLFPRYNYMSTTVRDVITISDYKGLDTLEKAFKTALLQNEFWKAKFADLTKKAASSKEWTPKFDDHLKNVSVDVTDKTFEGLLKHVVSALADYALMVESLRVGSLQPLDAVLLTLIPIIADKVLNASVESLIIKDVENFIYLLRVFESYEFVQDIKLQLDKWKLDMASSLCTVRLGAFLDEALVSPVGGPEARDLDMMLLKTHLQDHSVSATDEIKAKLRDLMPTLMDKLRQQAGHRRMTFWWFVGCLIFVPGCFDVCLLFYLSFAGYSGLVTVVVAVVVCVLAVLVLVI